MDARRPELVLPQLKLIVDLTHRDRFVKPHDELLADDIRHFTWNGEPDSPFIRELTLGQLRSALTRILNGQEAIQEFEDVIKQNADQKARFLSHVSEIRTETHPQIQELRQREKIPPFEQYLEDQSERVARAFAHRIGLEDDCARIGIANLLKLPSVRIAVGLSLSLIYRTAVEGKSPKRGAS